MARLKDRLTDRSVDVQNLAESVLRLCEEVDRLKQATVLPEQLTGGLNYALSDAKGEARRALAKIKFGGR